jgi:transposase
MSLSADHTHHSSSASCPECLRLEEQVAVLSAQVLWFEEQHRLEMQRRFGASSERMTATEQQELIFNEAEALADPSVPEPTMETIASSRRKAGAKGLRDAQLANLPTETITYALPVEEQVCPSCQNPLHKMDDEVRQELTIIPMQVRVTRHVRHVYSCRHCERTETQTPVITAPMPKAAFPKSLASPAAVASVMSAKYVEGLPLYRQEQSFARLGLELSRQTLANWMIKGAEHLDGVYERLKQQLLIQPILHADETTLQVLQEKDRPAQTKSYLWLYRSGRDGPPIVLFEYKPTRAAEHPKLFLADYRGYLHVDGYGAYDCLPHVTLVGCWAHARRGFMEALTALPPEAQKKKTNLAVQGLAFCNTLFEIEQDLRDVTAAERHSERNARSRAVLDEFHAWLLRSQELALPKGATGKAIGYCLNQWPKLMGFLADGRLELDNNRSERSIKPFVIGRKNWLFANTAKGAEASARIYSIVESAKENGLNPEAYLTYLFEQLPSIDKKDPAALDRLLPFSPDLPESVRIPAKTPRAAGAEASA